MGNGVPIYKKLKTGADELITDNYEVIITDPKTINKKVVVVKRVAGLYPQLLHECDTVSNDRRTGLLSCYWF